MPCISGCSGLTGATLGTSSVLGATDFGTAPIGAFATTGNVNFANNGLLAAGALGAANLGYGGALGYGAGVGFGAGAAAFGAAAPALATGAAYGGYYPAPGLYDDLTFCNRPQSNDMGTFGNRNFDKSIITASLASANTANGYVAGKFLEAVGRIAQSGAPFTDQQELLCQMRAFHDQAYLAINQSVCQASAFASVPDVSDNYHYRAYRNRYRPDGSCYDYGSRGFGSAYGAGYGAPYGAGYGTGYNGYGDGCCGAPGPVTPSLSYNGRRSIAGPRVVEEQEYYEEQDNSDDEDITNNSSLY